MGGLCLFGLGVRCATVIPFAPYGSAVIAWTQKTLHPRSAYQIGTGGGVEGRRGLAPPPIR